jgi:hypothetical protein
MPSRNDLSQQFFSCLPQRRLQIDQNVLLNLQEKYCKLELKSAPGKFILRSFKSIKQDSELGCLGGCACGLRFNDAFAEIQFQLR